MVGNITEEREKSEKWVECDECNLLKENRVKRKKKQVKNIFILKMKTIFLMYYISFLMACERKLACTAATSHTET